MSDGRKRLSGAAYRKAALEKIERENEAVKKTRKIFNFFQKPSTGQGPSDSENNAEEPEQTEDLQLKKKDSTISSLNEEILCNETEIPTELIDSADFSNRMLQTSSNAMEHTETYDGNHSCSVVYDPALWSIDDSTREHVLKNGINQEITKLDFSRSKRFIGGQYRCLTQTLFKTNLINGEEVKRSYLMYSESSGKLFCIPCQLFGGISKLAKEGFDDWKHGNEHLRSHENSSDHKSCVLKMKRRMTTAERIDSQLLIQAQDEEKYWRNVLQRVVAVVRALAAAGLPLRGHFEKFGSLHNCGNFIMCMELIAEFDPFLANHIAKYGNPGQGHTSYLSSSTYEEFLKIMGAKVTQEIVTEVKAAKYFSLIIDSTPDISHVDQLAIIIRYVNGKGMPMERFLCFLPNVGHKSEAIFNAVIDVLENYGIDIKNCRGQSYDNASNMSGEYTGLQARIREISATAMYSPCSAHSLNLVGEHSTSSCKESRDFFLFLNNIYNFFSCSTKRWETLKNCLSKDENLSLKTLSKTRWSARDDACRALNEDWEEVKEALTIISNDEKEKAATRSEASSYLPQLQKLETAILSVLWGDLLARFNATNNKLQSPEIDLSTVSQLYGSLLNYLKGIRQEFEIYENGALVKAEVTTYEDESKRKKRRKLQPDESRDGEVELVAKENFRINTYNIIIDRLINEMERRKAVYDELTSLFGFFLNDSKEILSKKALTEHCSKLCSFYNKDLPTTEDFVNELQHFFGFLKELEEYPNTILNLSEVLHNNGLQDLYPYVDIALRLFLTIPASNCSAERSFSVLKRIKNYTRSTMTEERLRNLAILTIESELTKKLDFDDIIQSFSNSSSRRKFF